MRAIIRFFEPDLRLVVSIVILSSLFYGYVKYKYTPDVEAKYTVTLRGGIGEDAESDMDFYEYRSSHLSCIILVKDRYPHIACVK
jgi:hypothetical protein